jgi:hypothetical protein
MKCASHLLGLIWECRTPEECSDGANGPAESVVPTLLLGGGDSLSGEEAEEVEHRTYKDDSALKDQQSTGRKRAAKLFPLDETALCEWAGKKNCGGGQKPITGCLGNLQVARHHGPDKNTLNNEVGNVHRICATCHNRWHTLNDEGYDWTTIQPRHEPVEATILDVSESEEFWSGRKVVRAKD